MTTTPDRGTRRIKAAIIGIGLDGHDSVSRPHHRATLCVLLGGSADTHAEMLETVLRLEGREIGRPPLEDVLADRAGRDRLAGRRPELHRIALRLDGSASRSGRGFRGVVRPRSSLGALGLKAEPTSLLDTPDGPPGGLPTGPLAAALPTPARGPGNNPARRRILKRRPRRVYPGSPTNRNRRAPSVTLRDDRAVSPRRLRAGVPLAPGGAGRAVPQGRLRPLLPHDGSLMTPRTSPRKRWSGNTGGSPGSTGRGRSAPGSWGSPRIGVGPPSAAARDAPTVARVARRSSRSINPGLADPDDLAGELGQDTRPSPVPIILLVFALYHEQALPYEEDRPDDRPARGDRQDLGPRLGRLPDAAGDHRDEGKAECRGRTAEVL